MRVVGGRLGGRTLDAPPGQATRPTSDRVREALFSILGDLTGARVLDLYAGTGALGIEAISRGASHATFVEHADTALTALRKNVKALDLTSQVDVVSLRVERAMRKLNGSFDLIFVDPPYASVADFARAFEASQKDAERPLAAPDGQLVLEHGKGTPPPPLRGLSTCETRRYGDTALTFYVADPPVE